MPEDSNEATKGRGKTQSQQGLYAKFEPLVEPAVEKLAELLNSRNEAIALGAIRTILDRTLPTKKAVEVTGQDGEPIQLFVNAGAGFIPANVTPNETPTGGFVSGFPPIQSTGVAQKVQEDNNSNNGTSEASSS